VDAGSSLVSGGTKRIRVRVSVGVCVNVWICVVRVCADRKYRSKGLGLRVCVNVGVCVNVCMCVCVLCECAQI